MPLVTLAAWGMCDCNLESNEWHKDRGLQGLSKPLTLALMPFFIT